MQRSKNQWLYFITAFQCFFRVCVCVYVCVCGGGGMCVCVCVWGGGGGGGGGWVLIIVSHVFLLISQTLKHQGLFCVCAQPMSDVSHWLGACTERSMKYETGVQYVISEQYFSKLRKYQKDRYPPHDANEQMNPLQNMFASNLLLTKPLHESWYCKNLLSVYIDAHGLTMTILLKMIIQWTCIYGLNIRSAARLIEIPSLILSDVFGQHRLYIIIVLHRNLQIHVLRRRTCWWPRMTSHHTRTNYIKTNRHGACGNCGIYSYK